MAPQKQKAKTKKTRTATKKASSTASAAKKKKAAGTPAKKGLKSSTIAQKNTPPPDASDAVPKLPQKRHDRPQTAAAAIPPPPPRNQQMLTKTSTAMSPPKQPLPAMMGPYSKLIHGGDGSAKKKKLKEGAKSKAKKMVLPSSQPTAPRVPPTALLSPPPSLLPLQKPYTQAQAQAEQMQSSSKKNKKQKTSKAKKAPPPAVPPPTLATQPPILMSSPPFQTGYAAPFPPPVLPGQPFYRHINFMRDAQQQPVASLKLEPKNRAQAPGNHNSHNKILYPPQYRPIVNFMRDAQRSERVQKLDPKTMRILSTYHNIRQACEATTTTDDRDRNGEESMIVSPSDVESCCQGKLLQAGGFRWRFEDPLQRTRWERYASAHHNNKFMLVHQLDATTGAWKHTYWSVEEAIHFSGYKSIRQYLNKDKALGGWYWKLVDPMVATTSSLGGQPLKKPVQQMRLYDANNTVIKEFPSLMEASNATGIEMSSISAACEGHLSYAGGYFWRFASDTHRVPPSPSSHLAENKEQSDDSTTKKNRRPVEQLDPRTAAVIHRFSSVSEAKRHIKINEVHIRKCADRHIAVAGGYIWRWLSDTEPTEPAIIVNGDKGGNVNRTKGVDQMRAGKVIASFDSIKDAERATGIRSSQIVAVTKGRHPQAGGYFWRVREDKSKSKVKVAAAAAAAAAEAVGRYPTLKDVPHKTAKVVEQVDASTGKVVKRYASMTIAAKLNGTCNQCAISSCCRGLRESSGGFIWRYYDDTK